MRRTIATVPLSKALNPWSLTENCPCNKCTVSHFGGKQLLNDCLLICLGFRITAYGAAGGRSVQAVHKSHGVYMTGDFQLQKDELLYILVGQEGEDACPNVSNPFYQYIPVLLFQKM